MANCWKPDKFSGFIKKDRDPYRCRHCRKRRECGTWQNDAGLDLCFEPKGETENMDKPNAFNYEDYLRLKAENEALRRYLEEAKSALEYLTNENIRLHEYYGAAEAEECASCSLDSIWEQIEKKNGGT